MNNNSGNEEPSTTTLPLLYVPLISQTDISKTIRQHIYPDPYSYIALVKHWCQDNIHLHALSQFNIQAQHQGEGEGSNNQN